MEPREDSRGFELKIKNVPIDSDRPQFITFIHCIDEETRQNIILYARSDTRLGHHALLEIAQELDLIDEEEIEVQAGGHLDARTLDKVDDSRAFGSVDSKILESFVNKLRNSKQK